MVIGTDASKKLIRSRTDWAVYLCALLSCLVPRYSAALKIHLGINFSLFDMGVAAMWLLFVRRFRISMRFESLFMPVWALFIAGSFWRVEKLGVWAYYMLWIVVAIFFQQILYADYSERTPYIVCRALCDGLFIQLIIGIIEVRTNHYYFEIGDISRRLWGHVAVSMFMNLNDYATFIVTMFPFALLRFVTSRRLTGKAYALFTSVCTLYFAFVSECRGAFLALVILGAFWVYFLGKRKTSNRVLLLVFIVLLIVAVLMSSAVYSYLIERLQEGMKDESGKSNSARINLLKNGLYFLQETFGFGVGAGNLFEWLSHRSIYPRGHLSFIHNWYAEVLVTFGVWFTGLYCLFHAKLMLKLYGLAKKGKRFITLNSALFFSLMLFSIVSISSSSNIYSEWMWMYWAFLSVYCSRTPSAKQGGLPPEKTIPLTAVPGVSGPASAGSI